MKIKVTNDGKGKAQSFEAELVYHSDNNSWGSYDLFLSGYGANEFSAKENLKEKFQELLDKWNESKF